MMKRAAILIVHLTCATCALAQNRSGVSMERYDGGTIKTELSSTIVLDEGSSLKRDFYVIRDAAAPAVIDGVAGVGVGFSDRDYVYNSTFTIKAREPISAVEVRFVVLDVFGQVVRTLSTTKVTDISDTRVLTPSWRIWSETEAATAYASVAYIALARYANGRVYEANRGAVLESLRKVAKRVTEADLEPKKDPKAQ